MLIRSFDIYAHLHKNSVISILMSGYLFPKPLFEIFKQNISFQQTIMTMLQPRYSKFRSLLEVCIFHEFLENVLCPILCKISKRVDDKYFFEELLKYVSEIDCRYKIVFLAFRKPMWDLPQIRMELVDHTPFSFQVMKH